MVLFGVQYFIVKILDSGHLDASKFLVNRVGND